jgi:cell division protein DivIC
VEAIDKPYTMNSKLSPFLKMLAHYKYAIVIVVGVAYVGFIDDDSILQLIKYNLTAAELQDDIQIYNSRNEAATKELRELRTNPKSIEKIARERYFMKADDEDIYVLSDDPQPDDGSTDINLPDETTK